jgi:DnaJ-class molecular chaperone
MADLSDELFSSVRDALRQSQEEADNQHCQPGAGSDEVTLKEAYQGTIRLYTATTHSGQQRRAELKIPPGVDTGTRVRFAGYGKLGKDGGPPGDLYLDINVRPCARFKRRGADLYHERSANLAELALGVKLQISTLDDRLLDLTIPAGTKPNQKFRLAGQGMPQLDKPNHRGDLYVTVNAEISPGVKKLLREEPGADSQAAQDAESPDDTFIALFVCAVVFLIGLGIGAWFF